MFSLQHKTALVTGAGSGIGAAIAELFAKAGARVFVTDRVEESARAVHQRIIEAGHAAHWLQLDIAEEAQCAAAANRVLDDGGQLDILVNNAGVGHVGTLEQTEVADLDRVCAVNVRGTFLITKAFLPSMLARARGSIVNLASIGGLVGVRDRLAYTISKHAVVGLTRAMALDHAKQGIRINAICPGRVETPWVQERLREYPDPQKAYEEMCATQPMGRMGRPEEIAAAALYLASDEAAFVTGATLTPDGGWSAG
ncbi:MAG TPA: glucose 1-dehydrogenase [Chthoniobacteraceae bacterium]|nr:glucose 1-dehydrogenase [Chthoniobacteraceae bacterium]